MRHLLLSLLLVTLLFTGLARAEVIGEDTVRNPTKHRYVDAPVKLKVDLGEHDPEKIVVTSEGKQVPHQFGPAGGLHVMISLEPGETKTFVVADQEDTAVDRPVDAPMPALIERFAAHLLKAEAAMQGGPIYRMGRAFGPGEKGEGTVLALAYRDKPYVAVRELVGKPGGEPQVIDLSAGWKPTHAVMRRWFKKPFEESNGLEKFPLDPAALEGFSRNAADQVALELLPRWTQSPDQGWFFGVTDGEQVVGVMPIRAGEWRWPHENKITARIPEKGKAELVFPTHEGARTWLLIAGPVTLLDKLDDIALETSHAPLDKLHNEYVFSEPGRAAPDAAGDAEGKPGRHAPAREELVNTRDFFSNATNPTGALRQEGKRVIKEALAGKTSNSAQMLYDAQATFDPDWYGRYEDGWSPSNPNFYTDFIKPGVARAVMLRDHPQFEKVRAEAEWAFRSDVAHSITLSGGAGQECPGYQEHAMDRWRELAPLCAEHLKFDPRTWERYRAGAAFIVHTSVPSGTDGSRTFHPAGDTHPNRPEPLAWAREFGVDIGPITLETEELPGFGAVFRHKPGMADETFLSFKAGPNRGHYHGDQLSLHYAAGAEPLAIDHQVSYSPRAGQEHTHNRVSFSLPGNDAFKFANLDGYERLIAFKKEPLAEVAVAQVSSPRLRAVKEFPPEDWDDDRTLHTFADGGELVYRRTVVHVLPDPGGDGPGRDYFVIRDQWSAPEAVTATFNLHVKGDKMDRSGDAIQFAGMTLFVARPSRFDFASWPSSVETWLTEAKRGESTQGARASQTNESGEFLTVIYPGDNPPKLQAVEGGVRVGADEIWFGPGMGSSQEPVEESKKLPAVRVSRGDEVGLVLEWPEINLARSQGRIGLFVPDAGYPFGPIPQWLIDQRAGVTGEDVGAGE